MKPSHLGRRWTTKDFKTDPVSCAKRLIGTTLLWDGCGGTIVETEAYAQFGDEACHTFVRTQARIFVNERSAGTIYTYLNYGMHWLFNVLTKSASGNGFVLIRALEPTIGVDTMQQRRGRERIRDLCSGPGKLTQALTIGPDSHGGSISQHRPASESVRGIYSEKPNRQRSPIAIVADKRVGISKAVDYPWRFLLAESPFISKPLSKK